MLAAIPAQVSGLTKCDLVRLKTELREVINKREAPDKDKIEGICSCPTKDEEPVPSTADEKPDGFQAAQQLMPQYKAPPTKIPEYVLKPRPVSSTTTQKLSEADRLQQLEENVDQVISTTNYYQGEGLLSRSAEDFLKCCRAIKCKIQEYRDQKKVVEKLDYLKEQVSKLEKITDIVQEEELSTSPIASFKTCCQEFRDKIELRKVCKGAPSAHSIEKLINQIGDSITLSYEAKKEGLVSESVDDFIMSCKEIKIKIDPHGKAKPRVIDDLLYNIQDITDFISKYKDDGCMSESIERFYQTCQATKKMLENYKPPPPRTTCSKSMCSKNRGLKPDTEECKILVNTTGEDDNVTALTATQTQSEKKVTQQLQYSDMFEDSKVTHAEPSIEKSAKLQSQQSTKSETPQAFCDLTYTHNAEELQSRCSCKLISSKESIKAPCSECNYKTAKSESQRSFESKLSQDSHQKYTNPECSKKTESQNSGKPKRKKISTNSECPVKNCLSCTCKSCKKIKSLHFYKSDPNLASAVKSIDSLCSRYIPPIRSSKQTRKSCSAIVVPKGQKNKKDPNGSTCCKSVVPEKSKDNWCDLCAQKSTSNFSSNTIEINDSKNEHDLKGCDCGKFGGSGTCNSCTNLSAAIKSELTCCGKTMTTVRRFKDKDGSVIEVTETVIVNKRICDPEDITSRISSHATGSCHSVLSTRTIHVCEVPLTRGFIQTVRNDKPETFIRSQNLSDPYPPFVGSIEDETVQQDPFFCDSPTASDNGPGSDFHM